MARTLALALTTVVCAAFATWAADASTQQGEQAASAHPWAYLYPGECAALTETLRVRGIEIEELREDTEIDAEVFGIDRVQRAGGDDSEAQVTTLKTTPRNVAQRVAAGSMVVRTAQPSADLAASFLEPEGENAGDTQAIFGDALETGRDFPVIRIPLPTTLVTRVLLPLSEDPSPKRTPTLESIYLGDEPVSFSGPAIPKPRWTPDGKSLIQKRGDRMWRVEATTGRASPLADADAMASTLSTLDEIESDEARKIADRLKGSFDPDFEGLLFEHDDDLFYAALDGSRAVRLTRGEGSEEVATFSPDGRQVAFVRDHDLWVVDIESRTERALTKGGGDRLRRGKATWVYYEELLGRKWQAYWWSPDSKKIAFLEFDDENVPRFTLVDDIPEGQHKEVVAYPKPGQPNPVVRLGVVAVNGGKTRWADLARYDPEDLLIPWVAWWPGNKRVFFLTQNRIQTTLDVHGWVFADGLPERLLHETTEAWVGSRGVMPEFLDDGSFLLPLERDGWRHLYRFSRDGGLIARLTSGEWEARKIVHIDEKSGRVWFTGIRDSHLEESLYRVGFDGTGLERVTASPGTHAIEFDPTGSLFVDRWSALDQPTRVILRDSDGKQVRVLDTNPVRALEEFRVAPYESLQIVTEDGTPLEATMLRPPDFDPERRYPVWLKVYGGPHAPRVRNRWARGFASDQILAAQGVVVLEVDPRTASGKGIRSAWPAWRRLGVRELADLVEVVEWLRSKRWVDPTRIGIGGGSYGGFMTVYAMTHSKLFAAGIAAAPVTDWSDYDSIYTERYMGTPEENPEGYETTSAVAAAADLHGRLLLLHGTMDDNVHFQHTLRLVEALQKVGKQFEMMVYPRARHSLRGDHRRRLELDFILRTLNP
jgi:dipeptidyl aminopeptidase/acylaminoacyl peptidase